MPHLRLGSEEEPRHVGQDADRGSNIRGSNPARRAFGEVLNRAITLRLLPPILFRPFRGPFESVKQRETGERLYQITPGVARCFVMCGAHVTGTVAAERVVVWEDRQRAEREQGVLLQCAPIP
jgi:hypothetical protein